MRSENNKIHCYQNTPIFSPVNIYYTRKMSYDELNSLFNKSRNVYEEGKEKAKESNIDFDEKALKVMKEIITTKEQ